MKHNLYLKFKSRAFILLLINLCFCSSSLFAQQSVKGVVVTDQGDPLVGVSVVVENTTNGTSTNIDGEYQLEVDNGATLVFSFLGYETQSVKVNAAVLDVTMAASVNALDDVVVIGYGAVKRKDVLGSVSSVRSNDLEDRTSGNVVESMRGKVSGVKITSSGQPGSNPSIVIRGLGSLTNNSPLYIIDGVYGGSDLGVNVEDIESIQILKDASSAAIYGSRAANGVVIITTKQGREGGLKVKVDAQLSISELPRYDLMDAETYKLYDDRAYGEAILAGVDGVTGYQNHYDADTDWQDEMLQRGILQNYNVSLSGGTETLKYYTSFNRMDNKGAMKSTGYDKYGFRVNTSGKKGIFSYGENLYYTRSNTRQLNGNPWQQFIGIAPTIPVYDDQHAGGYGYGDVNRANNYGVNPVAMQELMIKNNLQEYISGNVYGQIDIVDMVEAKINVGYKTYNGETNGLRKSGNWVMGQGNDAAELSYSSARHTDILVENTYTFDKTYGKHDIDAIVGMSYNKFHEESRWISKLDPEMVGDKYITSLNAATGETSAGGGYTESALISYMGRVNYGYDDRYLVQLTARRDGTSRLPEDNRWGNFYSASLGWRISGEEFFRSSFIDDLKLRVNYGTLGNSSIGFWDYQSTINSAPRAVMGYDNDIEIGKIQSKLTNDNIRWERKTTFNVGADMMAAQGRLKVTAEYFVSKSDDLLLYLPILYSTGNEGGSPAVNAGSLSNTGFELELGWNDNVGENFNYYANVNMSRVKNKVLDLGYGQTVFYQSLSKSEIGSALGAWYLYRALGIFQNEEEIQNYTNADGVVIQPDALPGDVKYDDYDGDGKISSEDRQICGSPWPKLELGMNFGVSYKGLALDVSGYGRFGQTVYNGAAAAAGDFANNQNNFNGMIPWTQENPVNDRPRIVYGDSRNSRGDQSRWLEDGSFFRISDIVFSYTLPKKITKAVRLDDVRFSVMLQNMVTFTKYSGLDPEFADYGIYTIGADMCSFPNPRTIQFGISLGF